MKKTSLHLRAIHLAIAGVVATVSGHAATLNWNSDGSGAGSGTWDLGTTANWLSGATSTVWTASNDAVFAGTDGSADSYAISLASSSLNPTALTFSNTGYILTAPSATTLILQQVSPSFNTLTVASGKTATIGSNVSVGVTAGVNLTIAGGGTLNVGKADGSSIGATVLTNSVNIAQGDNLTINAATVNVYTGGTLATSGLGGGSFVVGSVAATISNLNVEGGNVVAVKDPTAGNEVTGSLVLANVSGSTATLNIDSGTVTLAANSIGSGGPPATQGGLRLGPQSAPGLATSSTVNLNGGTLTAPRIFAGSTGTNSTEVFNFNGGILQANKSDATAPASTFMAGLNAANVRDGGAKIDSNGFNNTISQVLQHSNIGGDNPTDGGLTKLGTGTLTLGGANTYTGSTTVQTGTLALASAGSIASSLTYSISNGATLDVSAKSSYSLSGISMTISTNGITGGFFNAGTKALTLAGNLTVNFTSAVFPAGSVDLLDFGSKSGDFDNVLIAGSINTALIREVDVWRGSAGGYAFSFNQTTGLLSFVTVPEPAAYALVPAVLAVLAIARKRCHAAA